MKTRDSAPTFEWAQPGAYACRDSFAHGEIYLIDRLTPTLIVCKVPAEFGGNGRSDYRFRRSDGRAYGAGEYGVIAPVTDEQVLDKRIAMIASGGIEQIRRIEGVGRSKPWGAPSAKAEDLLEQIDGFGAETRAAIAGLRDAAARP